VATTTAAFTAGPPTERGNLLGDQAHQENHHREDDQEHRRVRDVLLREARSTRVRGAKRKRRPLIGRKSAAG
jgi:hypothetical protein